MSVLFADDEDLIVTRYDAPMPPEYRAELEVDHYKKFKGLQKDGNPILYFQENQGRFPLLSAMV